MYMVLKYPSGERAEGILLAAGCGSMRVAVHYRDDAVELRQADGEWIDDQGRAVQFEALTTYDETDANELCSRLRPRTRGAGG